jgi:hypothetical protein
MTTTNATTTTATSTTTTSSSSSSNNNNNSIQFIVTCWLNSYKSSANNEISTAEQMPFQTTGDIHVDGLRLWLWTAATNGPIVEWY